MATSPQTLALRLLGPPELLADGVPVSLERRKALALLAYLALEPGEHPREALAALLAPDDEPAAARAGLRRALAELVATARSWLHATPAAISLRRDAAFALDVADFRAALAGPPAVLRAAVERYRGDFMAGFSLPGSPAFEEWQYFHAEALRGELAAALERLSEPELAQADPEGALTYARRRLALDPLHESAHRSLMRLYAATGQSAAALRQYRLLSETLARELGATPDEATLELYEQIRRAERTAQASRWSSAPPRLPAAPTAAPAAIETSTLPFLGREEELGTIGAALADPACRILTLIGPGGMGKTRLALHAAAQAQDRFDDGVYQVSLVGVSGAERMLTAIGATLGAAGQGDPLERLVDALRDRSALLVLDNADQALEGAPLLRGLVHRTRRLKLLITSRERLQLTEEWVVDLAGLAVPPAEGAADAASYSAVQLFAQRARQVRADFELTPAVLAHVAAICRLVEGMPLAIELAANWVRVLAPAEIAAELEQSMALLTTTLRDVPERHRSVEGVFAQSWERLSPDERQALRRLAIFEDGFTRVAASEVAVATPLVLAGLADKAMIRRDRTGRYAIHELLRHYAAHHLAADEGESREITLRFCRYGLRQLELAGAALQGSHQRQALAELEAEYDNLWKAWDLAMRAGLLAELDGALDGLYRLHELRGWYTDGIQALELLVGGLGSQWVGDAERGRDPVLGGPEPGADTRDRGDQHAPRLDPAATLGPDADALVQHDRNALLASDDRRPTTDDRRKSTLPSLVVGRRSSKLSRVFRRTVLVARARARLGALHCWVGQFAAAEAQLEAALPVLRAHGAALDVAFALTGLGIVASERSDVEVARGRLDEGLAAYKALGYQPGIAWAIDAVADLAGSLGDYEQAREGYNASSTIFSALGDEVNAAWSLSSLGRVLGLVGEHASARQLLEESLAIFQALGDRHGAASTHANLGEIAHALRDPAAARGHWIAALRLAREVGALPLVLDAMVGAALIDAEAGQPQQARAIAALALTHPATWQETSAVAQAVVAIADPALGHDTAEQAARRGRATPWEVAAGWLLTDDAGDIPT
jgi:predicted ATPase/DNA-binding SARP family transcriptional activator